MKNLPGGETLEELEAVEFDRNYLNAVPKLLEKSSYDGFVLNGI